MINFLFSYGGVVEFDSDISADSALAKLNKLVRDRKYENSEEILLNSRLKGRVSRSEVVLHRVVPVLGNFTVKPIFYGKLIEHGGKATLRGKFSISRMGKVMFVIWNALVIVIGGAFLHSILMSDLPDNTKSVSVLVFAGALVLGWGFHLFWKWVYRNDVKWISSEIKKAMH